MIYKIYLILAITNGAVQWKVGITTDIIKRLQTLRVGNPNIDSVQATYEINNRVIAYMVESLIKRHLRGYKITGEWFEYDSLNKEFFLDLCAKYEYNAKIHIQIKDNIKADKNNYYR